MLHGGPLLLDHDGGILTRELLDASAGFGRELVGEAEEIDECVCLLLGVDLGALELAPDAGEHEGDDDGVSSADDSDAGANHIVMCHAHCGRPRALEDEKGGDGGGDYGVGTPEPF